MSTNPIYHGRTNYIDIQVHFIRDLMASEQISLEYYSTNKQVADVFMKSLLKTSMVTSDWGWSLQL